MTSTLPPKPPPTVPPDEMQLVAGHLQDDRGIVEVKNIACVLV
jgi:hypothetical protein